MKQLSLLSLLLLFAIALPAQSRFKTTDFYVPSEKGTNIFVRSIVSAPAKHTILLVHGGVGGLAAFDPDTSTTTFAKELAAKGYRVYIMDVRGWEKSSFPDTLTASNDLAGYKEAATDISAVVNSILEREKISKVNLFGWASGGHWASYYTTLHNEKVERLIVLNSLYGVKAPWELNSSFSDPKDTTKYNEARFGRIRRSTGPSLLSSWDHSIPVADKSVWRDPAKAAAYQRTAVSFTKDAMLIVPGDFRKEAFYMANGRQYWNARDIKVPVLIMRGALDFWSRPEDITVFCNDLVNAPQKKCVTIEQATHMVFLDRPEKGKDALMKEIVAFTSF